MTAPRKPIDIATAKEELRRIDAILKEPLILVGGLAVQQYYDPRDTRDIDLVCDRETARRLVAELYPTSRWTILNRQDDYRPSFELTEKSTGIVVHFGPKILERGEYPHVPWKSLAENALKFRFAGDAFLHNIQVPLPHFLAYSKLISFIQRYGNSEKSNADLNDFINLSNHDLFSISKLHTIVMQNNSEEFISSNMQRIVGTDDQVATVLDGSCISFFTKWRTAPPAPPPPKPRQGLFRRKPVSTSASKTVYIGGPHRNTVRNNAVAEFLTKKNFVTKVPYDVVAAKFGNANPNDPGGVREILIDAILGSEILLVDVDNYGLDTAWEIGFAEGLNKFIVGYNRDINLKSSERLINRRLYNHNFMHGWDKQKIYPNVEMLIGELHDKTAYICGPFHNKDVEKFHHEIEGKLKKVICPKEYVPSQVRMPRDYPLQTRANAISQMDECDVLVVVLPRYGMDASWQIGYATAKKKEVVGIMMLDDHKEGDYKSIWDHWMNGWKEKDIFTGLPRLGAALSGYVASSII